MSSAPSRGLCDRMQRVVDMTTSLNRSFVDFMQSEKDEEVSEEEDVDRARRLMMFRTILQDLRQAHTALQEALDRELYGGKREPQRQRAKPRQRKPRAPRGSCVTKELVVKLTPVPVETSGDPETNADPCSVGATTVDMAETNTQMKEEENPGETVKTEGRVDNSKGPEETKVEEECEGKGGAAMEEENSDDEDEEDELEMAEENKRSPRVKMTPRRRRSDATHAGLEEDSDSDEVPAVLLQTATAAMASSEEEGGVDSDGGAADPNQEVRKQCLFGLVKTTPPCQDRTSRKRKLKERSSSTSSSSSSSVVEVGDSGSKVRRTVGLPHKVTKTAADSESSSSDQEMDSSDSDELDQKIKPLNDVTLMGSGTFQQSSGDEVDTCPAPIVLDEDDVENRIAKQLLLAEIRANLSSSSGQDDTSDAESKVEEAYEDKDGMKEGDGEKNDAEDSELTDNSSDSDGPARPSLSRHCLLQCSVTPWEVASQDDGNKPDDKRPKRKKTQSSKISDSSDERESASEDSALSEVISQSEDENASVLEDLVDDGEPRTPPSTDIGDGPTDGENAENCMGTPKGRRKIRKILEVQQLAKETQEALKEEEERRKRLAEREQQRRQEEERKEHGREDSEVMIIAKIPATRPIPLVLELDDATRECLVQVDTQLLVKLKPHQRQGVQFMWDSCCESIAKVKVSPGSGCLLAHCMGLGKTLQVITFLHTVLTCERVELKTALVVCPLNTVLNWRSEFDKWQRGIVKKKLEVMDLVKVKSVSSRVNALTSWHKRGGVMILSYELYRILIYGDQGKYGKQQESLLRALQDPGPDIVVCDEGHLLKNEATAICKAMRSIRTRRRIVLTGTPLQNNLSEYHCMVSFVKQNLLGSLREFRNRFMNPIQNGQCADSTPSDVRLMKKRVHVLHELLAGCVQRRDYTVLMPFLPPKREYVLSIRMTPLQCRLYTHYLQNCTREGVNTLFQDFQILSLIWTHPWCLQLSDHNRGNKGRVEEILSEIAETGEVSEVTQPQNADERVLAESRDPNLAKTSPEEECRVVTGSIPGWYREFVSDSDAKILEHSGKLMLLMEILHCAEQQHEKVLVFSQSLVSLDLIETFLELANKAKIEAKSSVYKGKQMWVRNKDYYRLTGSTTATARRKWAQEFNNVRNTRCRLFLISTRAGSLGINLVAANRVVVFDASWNPVYDIQSMFRVYRFGQKKAVYIYRFLAQGTMEQKIYERQVAKQSLSSRVVDQQQIQRHFTQSQLRELYHFQPDTCVQKHIGEPADKVLAVLLQCCGEAIVSFHEHDSLLGHRVEEELSMEERKEAWEEYKLEETRVSAQDSGELWRKSNQELKAMLESGHMDLQKASQNIKPKCLEVMKLDPMMDKEKLKQKAVWTYERFKKDTQGRVEIYQRQVFSQQKILENRAGLSSSTPPSLSVSSAYEARGSFLAPPTPLVQSSQSNGSVNQPQ